MTKETQTDEVISNLETPTKANTMMDKTHVIENTTWAVPVPSKELNLELKKALFNVQKTLPKIKIDSANKFIGNKYSSLKAVLNVVLPILHENDILLEYYPGYDPVKENHFVACTLTHVLSGQDITRKLSLVSPSEKNKTTNTYTIVPFDMQSLGSAQTYARRYLILMMLGICSELDKDDDGNLACNIKSPAAEAVTNAFNKIPPVLIKSQPSKETPIQTTQSTLLQQSILNLWENCWVEAYEMDNDLAQKIKMHIETDFKNASVESLTKMKTWLISVNKKD